MSRAFFCVILAIIFAFIGGVAADLHWQNAATAGAFGAALMIVAAFIYMIED